MAIITPNVGDFFPVGLDTIYVVEVTGGSPYDHTTNVIGHDDSGNEVEVEALMLTAEEYDEEYGTNYSDHDEDADEPDPWPYKHQDL